MTVDEIINDRPAGSPGLLPLIHKYLATTIPPQLRPNPRETQLIP